MFEESLAVCGRLVWLYDKIKLVNDKQIENKINKYSLVNEVQLIISDDILQKPFMRIKGAPGPSKFDGNEWWRIIRLNASGYHN